MTTQAERIVENYKKNKHARINGVIATMLGLLLLVCLSQRSNAQMPCPDFNTAMDVEKSASKMQEEAYQISLRQDPLVRADVHFEISYGRFREAGIHAQYLISSYQLYLHMPPGQNRDFIERSLIINSALEIRSLMLTANESAARVRNPEIKRLITEGLAARDFLGVAFSRCLTGK